MTKVLSKETLVPLGPALALVAVLASGAVWINSRLQKIEYEVQNINEKLDAQESAQWERLRAWVALLKAHNPNLNIPSLDR